MSEPKQNDESISKSFESMLEQIERAKQVARATLAKMADIGDIKSGDMISVLEDTPRTSTDGYIVTDGQRKPIFVRSRHIETFIREYGLNGMSFNDINILAAYGNLQVRLQTRPIEGDLLRGVESEVDELVMSSMGSSVTLTVSNDSAQEPKLRRTEIINPSPTDFMSQERQLPVHRVRTFDDLIDHNAGFHPDTRDVMEYYEQTIADFVNSALYNPK